MDPVSDNPKSTKIELKLDIITTDPIIDDNPDKGTNPNADRKVMKTFWALLTIGVILLAFGVIKKKFIEKCRIGRNAEILDDSGDQLFSGQDLENENTAQVSSEDEELAVEDQ